MPSMREFTTCKIYVVLVHLLKALVMNVEQISLKLGKRDTYTAHWVTGAKASERKVKYLCIPNGGAVLLLVYANVFSYELFNSGYLILRQLEEKFRNSPCLFEYDKSCPSIPPFSCRHERSEREKENRENFGDKHWPLRTRLGRGALFSGSYSLAFARRNPGKTLLSRGNCHYRLKRISVEHAWVKNKSTMTCGTSKTDSKVLKSRYGWYP